MRQSSATTVSLWTSWSAMVCWSIMMLYAADMVEGMVEKGRSGTRLELEQDATEKAQIVVVVDDVRLVRVSACVLTRLVGYKEFMAACDSKVHARGGQGR